VGKSVQYLVLISINEFLSGQSNRFYFPLVRLSVRCFIHSSSVHFAIHLFAVYNIQIVVDSIPPLFPQKVRSQPLELHLHFDHDVRVYTPLGDRNLFAKPVFKDGKI
jgi:hypothetical protein